MSNLPVIKQEGGPHGPLRSGRYNFLDKDEEVMPKTKKYIKACPKGARNGLSGPDESPGRRVRGTPPSRARNHQKQSGVARTIGNPTVNASGGATSPPPGQSYGGCRVCGKRFAAYRIHQVYCSPRCRLMAWACRQLVRDYKAGRLPGLGAELTALR